MIMRSNDQSLPYIKITFLYRYKEQHIPIYFVEMRLLYKARIDHWTALSFLSASVYSTRHCQERAQLRAASRRGKKYFSPVRPNSGLPFRAALAVT